MASFELSICLCWLKKSVATQIYIIIQAMAKNVCQWPEILQQKISRMIFQKEASGFWSILTTAVAAACCCCCTVCCQLFKFFLAIWLMPWPTSTSKMDGGWYHSGGAINYTKAVICLLLNDAVICNTCLNKDWFITLGAHSANASRHCCWPQIGNETKRYSMPSKTGGEL